ncbi:MAG: CocE/NonD family hydrolase [Thermoplasmatota archaeon]
MDRLLRLAALAVVIPAAMAGCLSDDDGDGQEALAPKGSLVPVTERNLQPFDTTEAWSKTLVQGVYDILPGVSIDVPVEIPLTEVAASSATGTTVNIGLFMPDVPEGTPVPVIADVGPYYSASSGAVPVQLEGDTVATEPANRLGRFLIENLVPHGYAVAQVSVVGTGDSSGCQDLMGTTEQLGVDAAVRYLAEQDWSNGNVGLIGRSYDGSTPWQAATFDNPALKTIVPISGLTGVHELMWRNGTSETRGGTGILYALYAAMTIDGDAGDLDAACQDYLTGIPQSNLAYVTGDHAGAPVNDYWVERYFFDRALENYNGSVYYIHGMQDWNVDPHMAFPYYQRLIDAGFEVKGLFGQWDHAYPDRDSDHADLTPGRGGEAYPLTIRYDWAQDLLEWFDHYLMETGPKPALHVEIQDNQGAWRIEETWPPADKQWVEWRFDEQLTYARGDALVMAASGTPLYAPGIVLTSEPLEEDLRIAGLPQLHVEVTPTGPGGQLFAYLWDATDDIHLGHATMDLRFYQGGMDLQTVMPNQPIVAKMELEPLDVIVPAGHVIELRFSQTGDDYLPGIVQTPVIVPANGDSVLRLPVIDAHDQDFFLPPVSEAQAKVLADN